MRLLVAAFNDETGPITQAQIAQSEAWMGSHPKHENWGTNQTSLRKVRQVIRDLRLIRGAPIISDDKGYWIPHTRAEVDEYVARLEQTAKAQAVAWHETYRAMDKVFEVRSEYFEAQAHLFDAPTQTEREDDALIKQGTVPVS